MIFSWLFCWSVFGNMIYIVAIRSHHCWKKPIVKRRQVLDGIPLSKAEQQQADEKFSGKAGSDHRMQPWGALVSHGFQQLMIWCWGSFCWAPGFLVLKIGGRKSAANLLPKYLQYHRGSFNQVALRYKPIDYVLSISIHNANWLVKYYTTPEWTFPSLFLGVPQSISQPPVELVFYIVGE